MKDVENQDDKEGKGKDNQSGAIPEKNAVSNLTVNAFDEKYWYFFFPIKQQLAVSIQINNRKNPLYLWVLNLTKTETFKRPPYL